MARPTKMTLEVQARIIEAISAGSTRDDAAGYAGIHPSTLYDWAKRGAKEKAGEFSEFSESLKKAEAECAVRNVTIIASAAQGGGLLERTTTIKKDGSKTTTEKYAGPQWTAAAWWLERRRSADWALKQKMAIGGDPDAPAIGVKAHATMPSIDTLCTLVAAQLEAGLDPLSPNRPVQPVDTPATTSQAGNVPPARRHF